MLPTNPSRTAHEKQLESAIHATHAARKAVFATDAHGCHPFPRAITPERIAFEKALSYENELRRAYLAMYGHGYGQ